MFYGYGILLFISQFILIIYLDDLKQMFEKTFKNYLELSLEELRRAKRNHIRKYGITYWSLLILPRSMKTESFTMLFRNVNCYKTVTLRPKMSHLAP